jgi:hypothetical protein
MFAICEVLPLSNPQHISLLVCLLANLGAAQDAILHLAAEAQAPQLRARCRSWKADRAHVHVLPRFELDLTFCKFAERCAALIFCQMRYSVLSSDDTLVPRPRPPWIEFKHAVQWRPRVALKMWRNRDEKE